MSINVLIKKDFLIFKKSRSGMILTFIVPMVITLIFGAMFGGFGGKSGMSDLKILLVDDDNSSTSEKLREKLDDLEELTVYTKHKKAEEYVLFDTLSMDKMIKKGSYKIGVYIPKGLEKNLKKGEPMKLEIRYDPKYVIEYNLIYGTIQKVIMQNFPEAITNGMFKKTREYLGNSNGLKFENEMSETINKYFDQSDTTSDTNASLQKDDSFNIMDDPLDVKSVQLLGEEEKNPMFAQYVAGMAVLFLLFSVTHAGATLLEEKNSGTIKRLLIAPVTRGQILVAKMIFITIKSFIQLVVLFIFGYLVFKLDIFKDIPALLSVIILTATAASSLGIFIASICKNQNQVNSLSTLVVLGMSALGGSMVPTMVMPSYMIKIGKFTLNYWSMKGFTDIFWRNLHIMDILPSLAILAGITIIFSFFAIMIFNKKLID